MIGRTFGRLTVVAREGSDAKRQATWRCSCTCGTTIVVAGTEIRTGHTLSCGCLRREAAAQRKFVDGRSATQEYRIWQGIITRCTNPNRTNYARYGGKGIRVSDEWTGSGGFDRFLACMGPRPSPAHSIDRFPNRHGNYEPGNVRWATDAEQRENKDEIVWLTLNGETARATEWARRAGVSPGLVLQRLRHGVSPEKALLPSHPGVRHRDATALPPAAPAPQPLNDEDLPF